MEKLFYKTCRHGNCGSNVTFHNKDERGYGTDLKGLQTYTLEQAQKEMNYQDGSLLLLKSEVDKFSVKHVDMQHLDQLTGAPLNMDDECVMVINGGYDGNDIQFNSEDGVTFDLSKAKVVPLQLALAYSNQYKSIWLKSYLESISRDTFQVSNINKRKMITGGGIKYRTKRRSTATGKARGNCPTCGKLSWGWDPHENAFCKKHDDNYYN
tara:strand:- start:38 stop:667 length:630 start_codon:yes stop_codon:yes gene_type:complete